MPLDDPENDGRMSQEDLRTWSMTYSLSIEVYVCAERYLMKDFKACIAASIINNFETVGAYAAVPQVLESTKTLHNGVSTNDPLLRKIFARVGFLQARLWRDFPQETRRFFEDDAQLTTLIMKEMAQRREEDSAELPAMEKHVPIPPSPPGVGDVHFVQVQGRRPRYDGPVYR